jgi:hypothetical protein
MLSGYVARVQKVHHGEKSEKTDGEGSIQIVGVHRFEVENQKTVQSIKWVKWHHCGSRCVAPAVCNNNRLPGLTMAISNRTNSLYGRNCIKRSKREHAAA